MAISAEGVSLVFFVYHQVVNKRVRKEEAREGSLGRTYNTAVSGKGKHHSRVTRHAEESTMPHANHNQAHQHHRAIVAKHIRENLQHGLPEALASDRLFDILDAEQEREDHEKSKKRGESHAAHNTNGSRPACISRFLG